MPEFVRAQNLFPSGNADPLPFEGLPEANVNPNAERAKLLNQNGENWIAGSEWKPKIKQEPGYPAALVSSEMKKEEMSKADFFNSPTSDSLVQRLFEVQHQQNSRMQELIQRQQASTLALTLPQPVIPTFSGNPIDYWPFIRAFENLIETKTPSESARLYYLVQYTTGEVQELVKSCLTMRTEDGYREARSLLRKRYGQGYRIARAFVDKLANEPPIKSEDGDALRRFSTTLTGCKNTLKEIGYLSKIENPDTLKAIVNRLPFGLRQRCRDVADNITENQEREITVEDLSNFVTTKARAADDASRGMIAEAITKANRWINGPDFLWQDQETWPKSPIMIPEEPQQPCEPPETKTTFSTLAQPVNQRVDGILKRFSSWLQLKRCIAWMLRFKNRLRNAVAKGRSGQKLSFAEVGEKIPPLEVLEVEKAENAIIKYV